MENEIKVGDYYLRLLLEEDERVSKIVREKEMLLSSETKAIQNGPRTNSKTSITESVNETESDTKSETSVNGRISSVETEIGAVGGVIKIRQRCAELVVLLLNLVFLSLIYISHYI